MFSQSSKSFFSYTVTTRVHQELKKELYPPGISFCIRYIDILDLEKLNREKGLDWQWTSDMSEIRKRQPFLTMDDIFGFTPPAEQSLFGCKYRKPDSFELIRSKDCIKDKIFTVQKYYTQEFICYHYVFDGRAQFSFDRVSNSLTEAGMMFTLDFSPAFDTADTIKIIAVKRKIPYKSKFLAPIFSRTYDPKTGNASYSLFRVTFSVINIKRQQPPYTTKCRKRGESKSNGVCSSDCMIEKIGKSLMRIPFQSLTLKPSPLKHVNYDDINHPNKSKILSAAEDACQEECGYNNCEDDYTITRVTKEERSPRDRLRIQVEAPRSPLVSIEYEPKLSLNDYLIFVCSTFGIWFGLSFATINPFHEILYFGKKNIQFNKEDNTKGRRTVGQRKKDSDSLITTCQSHFCLETRLIVTHLKLQVISLRHQQQQQIPSIPLYYSDFNVATKVGEKD